MGRPRKIREDETQELETAEIKRPRGSAAVITMTIDSSEGTVIRKYHIPGFVGNTLSWQRSGKGFDDIVIPALQKAFGGQVSVE